MAKEYEKFGFVKSPYEKTNPYLIEDKYLTWNREDLSDVRKKLDKFIDDVIDGRRVSIRVFGPAGSGKTWLTRILGKELCEKDGSTPKEQSIFIYTFLPELSSTFSTLYQNAIDYFLKHEFERLKNYVASVDKSLNFGSWEKVMKHDELCHVFGWISTGTPNQYLAKKWLKGEKISPSELTALKFTYALDTDYKKFLLLTELLKELSKIYRSVILVIDELEHVSSKLVASIDDSMRSLLDDFSENFALVASFTAQKEDEWYDIGFSEALSRRFDYLVALDSISSDSIDSFLAAHHKMYLKPELQEKASIAPFTKDSLQELLRVTSPKYHFPGYTLPNCGELIREAGEKDVNDINSDFLKANQKVLRFI